MNRERAELAVGWRGVGSALVSVARNNVSILPGWTSSFRTLKIHPYEAVFTSPAASVHVLLTIYVVAVHKQCLWRSKYTWKKVYVHTTEWDRKLQGAHFQPQNNSNEKSQCMHGKLLLQWCVWSFWMSFFNCFTLFFVFLLFTPRIDPTTIS